MGPGSRIRLAGRHRFYCAARCPAKLPRMTKISCQSQTTGNDGDHRLLQRARYRCSGYRDIGVTSSMGRPRLKGFMTSLMPSRLIQALSMRTTPTPAYRLFRHTGLDAARSVARFRW